MQLLKRRGHKKGKLLTSHRSTIYPCYLPVLGEFNRSWSYKTCRRKDKEFVCRIFFTYTKSLKTNAGFIGS